MDHRRFNLGAATIALSAAATWLYAHEGHVALPSRGAQVDAAKGTIVLSAESRSALDVKAAEIATAPLPESVYATVALAAPWSKHAYVSSRLPGRITRVAVQAGQAVRTGELIAELTAPELENLQGDIVRIQVETVLSRKVVAGLKESLGAVAQRRVIDAENALLQLEGAAAVYRAKWLGLGLDEAAYARLRDDPKAKLDAFPVTSPIDGTVLHIDLSPGKVVDGGEHLAEVIDVRRVHARVGVLEADMGRVRPGLDLAIRLTALPGEVFRAKIAGVDAALDPATNQNAAWAELGNPPGAAKLLPGMGGQAAIILPVPEQARVIPAEALIDDGLAQYVLVEEASAAKQSEYRRKNVVVVRRAGSRVEIQSPELFPGDRVVVQGAHELGGYFVPGVFRLGPEAARTLGIAMETASARAIDTVLAVDGRAELRPENRASLSSPLAGNIARLLVDRNAAVEKGQVVAEIFSLEFQSLQLDLIREQLAFDLADVTAKNLAAGGDAISRQRLLEAQTAKLLAANRVEGLKRRLEIAGLTGGQIRELLASKSPFETLSVRAPIAGAVVRFDKILGQGIRAEEPIFEVQDTRGARIEAFLAERELAAVRPGQKVRVRTIGDPGRVLTGTVAPGGRMLGADDRVLSVWIDLDGTPALKRGQLAGVAVVLNSSNPRLAVPRAAVLEETLRRYVFVRKPGGEWERRPVETGISDDLSIEILRGLEAGETVAAGGVAGLQTAYAAIR